MEKSCAEKKASLSTFKNIKSSSWFIDIKRLFWQYNLADIEDVLIFPPSKKERKSLVHKKVSNIYIKKIASLAHTNKTLKVYEQDLYTRKSTPIITVI